MKPDAIKISYGMWMIHKPRAYYRRNWFAKKSSFKHSVPMYPSKRLEEFLELCESKMRKLYPDSMYIRSRKYPYIEFTLGEIIHPIYKRIEVIAVCSIKDAFNRKTGSEQVRKRMEEVIKKLEPFNDPQAKLERNEIINNGWVYIEKLDGPHRPDSMPRDHNMELQHVFQQHDIDFYCQTCGEKLILYPKGPDQERDTRLWCDQCKLYRDTLLHLRSPPDMTYYIHYNIKGVKPLILVCKAKNKGDAANHIKSELRGRDYPIDNDFIWKNLTHLFYDSVVFWEL